jgi:glutamyl-tRNA reductase
MRIGVLGVNHKQANLVLREKMAHLCAQRFGNHKIHHPQIDYVWLSTCNRTEIYFYARDLMHAHSYLLNIFKSTQEIDIEQKVYSYFGLDCMRHLIKVTAGLDSALFAESEIQGQVKEAYETTRQSRCLPYELHFLFQKALKRSKEIRHHYLSALKYPSLEDIVYSHIKEHFHSLPISILFVGLSNINLIVAEGLRKKGLGPFTWCNRSEKPLPADDDKKLPWTNLFDACAFDCVIVATKSVDILLNIPKNEAVLKQLLIDLSIPRNIDPTLGLIAGTTLLNIEQLLTRMGDKEAAIKQCIKQIEMAAIEPKLRLTYLQYLKNRRACKTPHAQEKIPVHYH